MLKEFFWVGIAFDRDHEPDDDPRHVAIHAVLTRYALENEGLSTGYIGTNKASVHTFPTLRFTMADVFRADDGKRIGFGQLVSSLEDGRPLISEVANWLREFGIGGTVAVFKCAIDIPDPIRASQTGTDMQEKTSIAIT